MTAKITHFMEYKEAFPENLNHKILNIQHGGQEGRTFRSGPSWSSLKLSVAFKCVTTGTFTYTQLKLKQHSLIPTRGYTIFVLSDFPYID